MSSWLLDVRYVVRALGKRPLYAALTIAVFTIAIGANATVFGVFNVLYLRAMPYPDGDRIVQVFDSLPKIGVDDGGTSIPNYLDRLDAPSLESLALVGPRGRALGGEGPPEQVDTVRASPSLFDVLRVEPELGRWFNAEEAVPGRDRVVVLSHRLWSTRFGARESIVGEDVRLDGELFRVIGVMPPGFSFPSETVDLWEPFAYTPEQAADDQRGNGSALSVGRLRDGATIEGLEAELAAIIARTLDRLPDSAGFAEATGYTGRARLLRDYTVGDLRQLVVTFQAVVLAVLLIASANVANLQLSRVIARRRELSVRAALGADRWRLTRLVLVESLVLAALGGAGGLGVAWFGLEGVGALGLDGAESFTFGIDAWVIGFGVAAALAAAVLAGSLSLTMALRPSGTGLLTPFAYSAGVGGAGWRSRGALTVLQVSISVALLSGAGLLAKSFYLLQRQGPGFVADNVWTGIVALPEARYPSDESRAVFFEQALQELRALPGVLDAGVTSALPFAGSDIEATISVDGYEPAPGAPPPIAQLRSISDAYFDVLRVPVIKGRDFSASEPQRAVIVSESLANAFWPAGDALGQRVRVGGGEAWATIVGVVPQIKHGSLADSVTHTIYWLYSQKPWPSAAFVVSSALPPEQFTLAARATIARIDPDLAVHDIMPMRTRVERSLGSQRTPMALMLAFSSIAAVLAIVGIYGVLTWAVTQRVAEIGVRMAFGARAADIARMILGQGGRLVAIGLIAGIAGAWVVGRVLAAQLPEVPAFDLGVLGATVLGLGAAALIAGWLPARRAARLDAMQALRAE